MRLGAKTRRSATALALSGMVALSLAAAPAAASDPPDGDIDVGSVPLGESALAQDRFSALLLDTLGTYPAAIVDFSWHGDHGRILTTPGMEDEVAALVHGVKTS